MRIVLTVSSFCLCLTSAHLMAALPAAALDPSKLSIYQPLTVQDAYPTTTGTVQVQGSARYDETSTGRDLIDLRPVVKWGAFEHFQLSFAAPFRLGDASSSRSGDSLVAAFYQFAEDRNGFPAMALSQSVHEYFGDLHGTETVTNLLATKSLSGDLSGTEIHLNLSYRRLYDGAMDERENRYQVVVGVSRAIGEDLAILADFVRQDDRRVGETSNIIEVGERWKTGDNSIISLGVGAGIGDQSARARVLAGFKHAFDVRH